MRWGCVQWPCSSSSTAAAVVDAWRWCHPSPPSHATLHALTLMARCTSWRGRSAATISAVASCTRAAGTGTRAGTGCERLWLRTRWLCTRRLPGQPHRTAPLPPPCSPTHPPPHLHERVVQQRQRAALLQRRVHCAQRAHAPGRGWRVGARSRVGVCGGGVGEVGRAPTRRPAAPAAPAALPPVLPQHRPAAPMRTHTHKHTPHLNSSSSWISGSHESISRYTSFP